MPAWKAYEWEEKSWPEFQDIKIDRPTQIKYVKKLTRHFKTQEVRVENSQRRGGAGIYYSGFWYGRIKVGKETTLGTLCHEFAHHLTRCRHGRGHHHDKKFKRELKRIYTWSKRWLPKVVYA